MLVDKHISVHTIFRYNIHTCILQCIHVILKAKKLLQQFVQIILHSSKSKTKKKGSYTYLQGTQCPIYILLHLVFL